MHACCYKNSACMHADTLDVDIIQPIITEQMVQLQRVHRDSEDLTKSLREKALAMRKELVLLYKSTPYDDQYVYSNDVIYIYYICMHEL